MKPDAHLARSDLRPGSYIVCADPGGRVVYGDGVYRVERVGLKNVRASIDVRFSPTGPFYHQEHVIPIAHVARVVASSEVILLSERSGKR